MPELPEVETVRDGLERFVVGATVGHTEVFREYSVRRHAAGPMDFAGRLTGRRVLDAARRGKYLWLSLSPSAHLERVDDATSAPDDALLAHLGMSGQLLVRGGRSADEWSHPHLRVRIHLTGAPVVDGETARYLDFVDQRTFGHLSIQDLVPEDRGATTGDVDARLVPEAVSHIAPDLLEPLVDLPELARRIRRRRTQIKRALLDQTAVSGVGNIYADEALWLAGVHGRRATQQMRQADVVRVLEAAVDVMRAALRQGGTSFDALYVNVNGESGYFARSLNVYGRTGHPCKRCGTAIAREIFMNRSSHFCPVCQRKR